MHKPVIVETPHLHPSRCLFCGTQKGAMLDTQLDDPADPMIRIYVCLRNCLPTFATVAGWMSPEDISALNAEIADLKAAILEANAEDRSEFAAREDIALRASAFVLAGVASDEAA